MKKPSSSESEEPTNYIGIAGWSIPALHGHAFQTSGSHLERYSQVFNCVEINSSFHRHHQVRSYGIWRDAVPKHFRFSVKLSRTFTHENKLALTHSRARELDEVVKNIETLGDKLAVLLVQLPPSLKFDEKRASRFFKVLKNAASCPIALEPRHESWASKGAVALLTEYSLAPVWADPAVLPAPFSALHLEKMESPLHYVRLHGSPVPYRSIYSEGRLKEFFAGFRAINGTKPLWCIFDNTTFGNAIPNAIEMQKIVEKNS